MTIRFLLKLNLFTLCLCCCFGSYARECTDFSTGWQFKKGPFPSDPVLFGASFDQGWKEVQVPHTWNASDMQIEKNSFYEGSAYYKKTYTPDESLKGKRIFLRFEGVASVAEVYINKAFAGNHFGAYSAFAIEISTLLKYGEENEILVKADNNSRPDVIPINHTLFGVYGGMYRPVQLIVTEKLNITVTDYASPGVYISQNNVSKKSADVRVRVKVDNKYTRNCNVKLVNSIHDMTGKLVQKQETNHIVLPQGSQEIQQTLSIKNPRLWQGLEDPYLYRVTTQLIENGKEIDRIEQPLGIRTFEMKAGDGMYLNGKKVPMYGVCRHQDWWQYGSALNNTHHATDLEIIKEMGATTIRFAHYQQAEYLYSKCDSIGFIIWAEIPFVNRVSTLEAGNTRQQLVELIRQNYNHPSIYVWGLHNEAYRPHEYTAALTSELHDLAKQEDPDRYTVSVNGYGTVDHPVNMNADIQGFNRYYGWYEKKIGNLEEWAESLKEKAPSHKLILAEYGAEANINQQQEIVGETGTFFSQYYPETFATKFHEVQWGIIARHPQLLASYLWNTFDFATPRSHQGGVPARNMKGLVTFDRKTKKDPFYWYKANWSKEPVLYITQRRCIERENRETPVTVYSNKGIPTLYVNGEKITAYSQGTTPIHYIFDKVLLKEGKNELKAVINNAGVSLEDTIEWHYSPDNKLKQQGINGKENTEEHGGL